MQNLQTLWPSQSFQILRKKMKINFIIFFLLSNYAFSQKMYSVKYKSQADVKLFVVEYESQADLNVFKEKYKSNAKGNEGLWYFVEYQSQSDKKVYFVGYESQADLKIFFVNYRSLAGWKNREKMYLLY